MRTGGASVYRRRVDKAKFLPKARVVDRCRTVAEFARGKDVLHIGMGGYLENDSGTQSYLASDLSKSMHGYLSRTASRLTGLDPNPQAVETMRQIIPGEYVVGDITDPQATAPLKHRFDAVLLLDVIEHLDNFRSTLQNIRPLLNEDGRLVITTANAYCFESMLKMLLRYEAVHEEHTCYFSYLTMKRLLAMNGFEIDTFCFYSEGERRPVGAFGWLGYLSLKLVTLFFPQYAEGIFVVAKPSSA